MTRKAQAQTLDERHINAIVRRFNDAGIWNNGKFHQAVDAYCVEQKLDADVIHKKLEIAFHDYLATNISSEAAIRFRLSQIVLPLNVAL